MRTHLPIIALFTAFSCIQGTEYGPKAPPPVLLSDVHDMVGTLNKFTYPVYDEEYNVIYFVVINHSANIIKVFDSSNPKKPISTNQYRGEKKEEKKD